VARDETVATFAHYVALGDSMSIDLYPALDAGATDVAVALERRPAAGDVAPLGAASLLFTNDDARWPEFAGADLRARHPGIRHTNLARDGATIGDVFGDQLAELEGSDESTLVTLTVGGNDLLSALANQPRASLLDGVVRDIVGAYDYLVEAIAARLPRVTLLLATFYDPSDRTGRVPGLFEGRALPLGALDGFNSHVRALAARVPGARVADVYLHFLGHGVTAPEGERWYWRRAPTEPSARGASEIRRVWLEALSGKS
jgi:lysophospholipase L1-like esterase